MHILNDTKSLTDNYDTIRIADLRSAAQAPGHRVSGRVLTLGRTKARLLHDSITGDWYLDLIEPGPRCTNTAINIVRTRCNYGGFREWFECPGCEKRAGVLYGAEDAFRCRKCLNLAYLSQRIHHLGLSHTFKRLMEFKKLDPYKCRYYNGSPTRYTRRYEKLRAQVQIGMSLLGPRYSAK